MASSVTFVKRLQTIFAPTAYALEYGDCIAFTTSAPLLLMAYTKPSSH